jgi:hypothetical protein
MRTHIKLPLAALTAALVLSIAASSAFANRSLEVRGGPNVQSETRFTFRSESGTIIICDVTLRRTVARVIPKSPGTLFGKVTGIRIDRGENVESPHCASNGGAVQNMQPLECVHSEEGRGFLTYDCTRAPARLWKLIYDSFQGTLPRIQGLNVHIQGALIFMTITSNFGFPFECLYEGSLYGLLRVRAAESTIAEATTVTERTSLRGIRAPIPCPPVLTVESTEGIRPILTIRLL